MSTQPDKQGIIHFGGVDACMLAALEAQKPRSVDEAETQERQRELRRALTIKPKYLKKRG